MLPILQDEKHTMTVAHRASVYSELTWKQIGGGSSFIRTTAAGGTGNTPPGTGCKPGAEGEGGHETSGQFQHEQAKSSGLHTATVYVPAAFLSTLTKGFQCFPP